MAPPSFGKWLEIISIALLTGIFGLRVGNVTDTLLTVSLGGGAVGLAMIGYLIQRYEWKRGVKALEANEQAKALGGKKPPEVGTVKINLSNW